MDERVKGRSAAGAHQAGQGRKGRGRVRAVAVASRRAACGPRSSSLLRSSGQPCWRSRCAVLDGIAIVLGWGAIVLLSGDHFIWPMLVGGAARLPFLFAFVGVFGGLAGFGLVGRFSARSSWRRC